MENSLTNPVFSILITTKDRKSDLFQTLSSLRPLLSRNDVDCIVFDDGSVDGTSAMVADEFPQVRLHRNETSRGYMFCRNAMLNQTRALYAVSLDDDASFVSQDPLGEIKSHFSAHPECGVIAFRIFWGTEPPMAQDSHEPKQRVRGFVGCGHAWNMEAWHAIPDYPEWFIFYGEEEFASYQMFLKHIEVHYVPGIFVHHRVDMEVRKRNTSGQELRLRRSLSSGWYLFHLFLPPLYLLRHMVHSVKTKLQQAIKGRTLRPVKLVLLSWVDVLRNFPRIMRERRAMTVAQFSEFSKLPATRIYWQPNKDK